MTIFLPDISNYQGNLSLAGAQALIAKATQGTGYTDPYYTRNRDTAASMGIPFVAYHWVDASDLATQAAHAYSVAGATPMMWDAEAAGATVPRLVELTNRYRTLGGNPRLAYLPHWWWQSIGSPDLTPLAQAGLALVSSNYTTYTDTGPGWTPYGGVTPTIWQYTDAQSFNGQLVDFNAYKGTVNQLRSLLGGSDMPLLAVRLDEPTPRSVWIQIGQYRRPIHIWDAVVRAGLSNTVVSLANEAELNDLLGPVEPPSPAAFDAADAARDAATLAAIQALAAAGGVDSAPIVAAINTAAQTAHDQVAALQAEVTDLRARLAAAEQAAAGILGA